MPCKETLDWAKFKDFNWVMFRKAGRQSSVNLEFCDKQSVFKFVRGNRRSTPLSVKFPPQRSKDSKAVILLQEFPLWVRFEREEFDTITSLMLYGPRLLWWARIRILLCSIWHWISYILLNKNSRIFWKRLLTDFLSDMTQTNILYVLEETCLRKRFL